MAKNLPALHLFSIFEAAARHQSFKLASEELFLTPSAVSHQIKTLESFLGFELFQRKKRGVELNAAGQMYLMYVQKSLATLEKGTKKVVSRYSSPCLKISTFSTLASHVIIPQLPQFQLAHPDIDIRIETGADTRDLRYEDCDLAIRLGTGNWTGVERRKLLDIEIAAVCSPKMAKELNVHSVEQIKSLPLIDLSNMENVWQTFSERLGIGEVDANYKLSINSYDASLQAAEQGLGLALAMLPIENNLIKKGLLVNPFNQTVPFDRGIYAVYREEDRDRHDIHCFLNWLIKSESLQPLHLGE